MSARTMLAHFGARHGAPQRRRGAHAAGILFLLLASPAIRHALDATMVTQMLVQIPLLIAVGWLASAALPERALERLGGWNHGGMTGLVLASVASACWMLPRMLDAAVADPSVALLKYLSVPLLIGLPLALGWHRMGFVVRGVFLAELVATLFRLGWLYRVSPVRLCSRYPLDDQQRLGLYLLALGVALVAGIAWKLLFGRFAAVAAHASPAWGHHARAPRGDRQVS